MNEPAQLEPEAFGRYLLYPAIARGGMATVHTARLVGAEGFTRLVAAKRLHPQFTDDPDFVTMFHDEACIASRIHHPNVVPVLDVVVAGNELILVQEYVHGVPLSQLMKVAHTSEVPVNIDIAISVLAGVLAGLHAAHEVKDESGMPLQIVHRDVSPANVMISIDGVPRLLDFGIAKATTSTHHTREGVFKGKLAYMAPEQLRMEGIDRTGDIYATGVLAWEMLVNRRVYDGRHEISFVTAVMNGEIPSITGALADMRTEIDDARWQALVMLEPIISRAMADRPEDRYATADEMMRALLDARPPASSMVVAEWVRAVGAEFLDKRQRYLAANEESWRRTSLYTPSSGTQRVTPGSVMFPAVAGPPSSTAAISLGPPSGNMSVAPSAVVSAPSAAPARDSGFRVAFGSVPFAGSSKTIRMTRVLPWLGAFGFVVAGLVGGLLRGGPEPQSSAHPAPGAEAPAATTAQPVALPSVPASSLPVASATAAASAGTAAASAAAPQASAPSAIQPTAFWRPSHAASPPPQWSPPRAAPVARPAPPPPAATSNTATSTSTTSTKSECNPPFYFEGSKKIFKPSCL